MNVQLTDEIRQAILDWVNDKKLTQREVAKIIDSTTGAVSNILTGKSKSIRATRYSLLEPYINKYRNIDKLQDDIGRGLERSGGYRAELWEWDGSILTHINKYKKSFNLSYDDLSERFKIPVATLALLLEGEPVDKFDVKSAEAPAFAAMIAKIYSELFSCES